MDLQAFRSTYPNETDPFEHHHQKLKQFGGGQRSGRHGGGGEPVSMKNIHRLEGTASILTGESWCNGLFVASKTILNMKDYREGMEHLPCPLRLAVVQNLHSHTNDEELIRFEGAGFWCPGRLSKVHILDGTHALTPLIRESHSNYFPDEKEDIQLLSSFTVQFFTDMYSIRDNAGGPKRQVTIRVGDHVLVEEGENKKQAYCTIGRLMVVHVGGERFVWMCPRWFWVEWCDSSETIPKRHKIRKTILLNKDVNYDSSNVQPPIPVFLVQLQVGIQHSCKRKGTNTNCQLVMSKEGQWQDEHHSANKQYEVVDREAGFISSTESCI